MTLAPGAEERGATGEPPHRQGAGGEAAASAPRLSTLRGVAPFLVVVAILLVANALVTGQYALDVLYKVGFAIILAVSLNIVNGLTGQFSLGHAGFMAVGAFTGALVSLQHRQGHLDAAAGVATGIAALLSSHFASPATALDTGVVFLGATLVGGAAAAGAGLLVGLPSLRLRGDYLAIVTLGFGEIIRVVIENTPALGRATGLVNIPRATNLFWVYLAAFATVLVAWRLTASTHGRALLAIREDEVAAEAMGVPTTGYKVRAFVLSAFFAGVAGSLMAHYQQSIQPASFTFIKSIDVVVMVTLGGLGSTSGSVLAAIVLTLAPEVLRSIDQYRPVIYSELLVVLMLARPTGLMGSREIWDVMPALGAWRKARAAKLVGSRRPRPKGLVAAAVVSLAVALGFAAWAAWAWASSETQVARLATAGGVGFAATAAGLFAASPWGRSLTYVWSFILLNAGGIVALEYARAVPAGASVAPGVASRLLLCAAALALLAVVRVWRERFER